MGKKSTKSTTAPPQYIQQAQQRVIGQAQGLAGQPYQPYTGNLQAPFTPAQNAAFGQIGNAQGMGNQFLPQAYALTAQAANPIAGQIPLLNSGATNSLAGYAQNAFTDPTGNTLGIYNPLVQATTQGTQAFMDPYRQDVVRSSLDWMNNQDAQQQNSLIGNAISGGAWGGGRSGVAQGVLGGQQALAKDQTIANLLSQGYGQALGASQNALGMAGQLGMQSGQQAQNAYQAQLAAAQQAASQTGLLNLYAGQQMQGLGTGAQANQLQGAQALLGAGNQQQQQAQQGLNIPYQQWQQQQQWPYQQMGWLSNIINGQNAGGTSTQPGGNLFSSLLGGAGALSSMGGAGKSMGSILGNIGSFFALRDGGRVGYAPGGAVIQNYSPQTHSLAAVPPTMPAWTGGMNIPVVDDHYVPHPMPPTQQPSQIPQLPGDWSKWGNLAQLLGIQPGFGGGYAGGGGINGKGMGFSQTPFGGTPQQFVGQPLGMGQQVQNMMPPMRNFDGLATDTPVYGRNIGLPIGHGNQQYAPGGSILDDLPVGLSLNGIIPTTQSRGGNSLMPGIPRPRTEDDSPDPNGLGGLANDIANATPAPNGTAPSQTLVDIAKHQLGAPTATSPLGGQVGLDNTPPNLGFGDIAPTPHPITPQGNNATDNNTAMLAASLRLMAGQSPFFLQNIGQAGLYGLSTAAALKKQRAAEAAAQEELELRREQANREAKTLDVQIGRYAADDAYRYKDLGERAAEHKDTLGAEYARIGAENAHWQAEMNKPQATPSFQMDENGQPVYGTSVYYPGTNKTMFIPTGAVPASKINPTSQPRGALTDAQAAKQAREEFNQRYPLQDKSNPNSRFWHTNADGDVNDPITPDAGALWIQQKKDWLLAHKGGQNMGANLPRTRTPSKASILKLQSDPSLKAIFDATYGAGSADRYLGQQ